MDEASTFEFPATSDWTQAGEFRSRLAAIVDSSEDAIISKNLNGVILTWNHAAERLFGYSEQEAVGRPITIIIPPDLFDEEKTILRRLQCGQRIEHYETRRLRRDGAMLDVSLSISPLRNEEGEIVGASKVLRDITENRASQASLLESRQRLEQEIDGARTLQRFSTQLISETERESLIELVLEAAMKLMAAQAASIQTLSYDDESLTLLGWRNFHPDSAVFWNRVTAEAGSTCGVALRNGARVVVSDVEACEFVAGTPDLEEYRRSGIRAVQSTPLRSRSGSPLGMISTHWHTPHTPTEDDFRLFDVLARQVADLIERRRAECAMRESEERFRLMANTAPVTIWMDNPEGRCTYINQTWLDLTGQSFEAALGEGWTSVVHPDDIEQCANIRSRAFDRREPFQIEFRIKRHDGELRWIIGRGVPRYNADGSFAGYIGSAMDVTEKRLAEEALATMNQRLIDAQEEERGRIARELHDDIAQRLALVTINLRVLAQASADSAMECARKIEETRVEVANLAKDVQSLSHRLHPATLDYLGIAAAAAALCREMSSHTGVEISLRADRTPRDLPRRIVVCLYRVLQEALQNAIKHSGARKIDVWLRCSDASMELTVSDGGDGFDLESANGRGLGLVSMRERLKAVHGRLVINSEPARGTTIQACVPLLQDDPEGASVPGVSLSELREH